MSDLFPTPAAHDPGGKVMIALAPDVVGGCVFGGLDERFRYSLMRWWRRGPSVLVVMMNPSTANPMFDDPTVAKITRMARRWHNGAFGRLYIGNVFAYRATDQAELGRVADPIGPENDAYLGKMAAESDLVVFAYGTPKVKACQARGPEVVKRLALAGVVPHFLRMGKGNRPWHPLYLPDMTEPQPWPSGLAWSPT